MRAIGWWMLVLAVGCAAPVQQAVVPGGRSGMEDVAQRLAQGIGGGKQRVAVVGLRALGGRQTALSTFLSDKLVLSLSETEGLSVIERSRVAEILEEHAFAMSGVVDADSAGEVGGLVAADILVVGTVTVLAREVDVSVRAVEAASGKILAAADARLPRDSLADYVGDDTPAAAAPPLALSTIIFGERSRGGSYEEVVVGEGSVLSSGDGLKIVFETNRDAHVYALLLDSSNAASVVFPHADISTSNRVIGGRQVEIPPGDQWFFLDANTGTETIYILASVDPMPDIDGLARRLQDLGTGFSPGTADTEVTRFVGGGSLHRGIGGIKKGGAARVQLSDGSFAEQAKDLLSGAGAVVRAVSFEHR